MFKVQTLKIYIYIYIIIFNKNVHEMLLVLYKNNITIIIILLYKIVKFIMFFDFFGCGLALSSWV